jgi:hypothetical protein
MAIKTFKEILDNKGYRINSNDRKIFEQGNFQSFFGLSNSDAIEFVVYDVNDNQLPQKDGKLVRYVQLTNQNIADYFMIAEGTIFQKYKLPSEYFIDVERLLREAGYNNGIFKTQITLLNKRVGSENNDDKLWISEISPSRTEVRLFPIKSKTGINKELEERFGLFLSGQEFRDDTINSAFNFIEKITPTVIGTFMKQKYSEAWVNKMIGEFKIKSFENFLTLVHTKFLESAIYEFTGKISDFNNINYGKPNGAPQKIALSRKEIIDICKKLLVSSVNYNLPKQNITSKAEFDTKIDASFDEVGNVLQKLESATTIDTSSPIIKTAIVRKLVQTDVELELEKKIKKEIQEPDVIVVTPKEEPPYVPPAISVEEPPYTRGDGGGGRSSYQPINYDSGLYNGRNITDRGRMEEYR